MIVLYLLNCIRTIPCYFIILASGALPLLKADLEKFKWYIAATDKDGFFKCLNRLMLKNKCFRNVVAFRVSKKHKFAKYLICILFPIKQDLEIYGDIEGGWQSIMDMGLF